jgi:ribosomal protein L37AE/L43A
MAEEVKIRVEPVECPRCGSTHTRLINRQMLYCLMCGKWSNPYESPSFKRALAKLREGLVDVVA